MLGALVTRGPIVVVTPSHKVHIIHQFLTGFECRQCFCFLLTSTVNTVGGSFKGSSSQNHQKQRFPIYTADFYSKMNKWGLWRDSCDCSDQKEYIHSNCIKTPSHNHAILLSSRTSFPFRLNVCFLEQGTNLQSSLTFSQYVSALSCRWRFRWRRCRSGSLSPESARSSDRDPD